jgi:very-short-patch-repair endonuclease
MSKYNKEYWEEVQKYYDMGHTTRECAAKFNFAWNTLYRAKNKGWFIPKERAVAVKLHNRVYGSYKHTKETKQKLSTHRKQYLKDHPEKVPYKLNHYSKKDSYPEIYFKEVFEKESIDLKHHKDILCYELDFYNLDKKIYFEVDGEQHYVDKRIVESDIRRNKALFEEGWIGARIRWSTYQKLDNIQKQEIIKRLKQFIESNNRSIPMLQIV